MKRSFDSGRGFDDDDDDDDEWRKLFLRKRRRSTFLSVYFQTKASPTFCNLAICLNLPSRT